MSKILIIDDEVDICESIKSLVEDFVSEVATATSAQQALELLKKDVYQLIISDINMPKMSGIELLSHLRASGYDYPVVFVTASDAEENVKKALRLGASDFISKPFKPKEFLETVAKFLEVGRRMTRIDATLSAEDKEKIDKEKKMIGLLKASNSKIEKN